jgi:FkbM family methyltransferase
MIIEIKENLKKYLPSFLVEKIKLLRKRSRNNKRFSFNKGKDILKKISNSDLEFYIYLNPYLNGGVDEDIFNYGEWEPEISEIISRVLPRDGTFLDIGGNIGYHSLYSLAISNKNISAVVFEPVPRLVKQIQASAEYNGYKNIKIHNVGLSDNDGVGHLSIVEENIGASSLQSVGNDRDVSGVINVKITKLDNYLSDFSRLDLVKIDIEGAEFEALKGAKALLSKFRPVIVIEVSPHVYEADYEGKTKDLYLFLTKELNYSLEVIGDSNFDINKSIESRDFKYLHTNLLCTPK